MPASGNMRPTEEVIGGTMIKVAGKPVDVDPWVEVPLDDAPPWWCLPGDGGRIVVRGYDQYWFSQRPIAGSQRWALDIARVPVTTSTATSLPGPGGPVYPGDSIVYFGVTAGHAAPWAWFPQRVIRVFRENAGRATVWSLIDLDPQCGKDEAQETFQRAVAKSARAAHPVRGQSRRALVNLLRLAVECPGCGARGRPLVPDPRGPHEGHLRFITPANSQAYECLACRDVWAVSSGGEVLRIT